LCEVCGADLDAPPAPAERRAAATVAITRPRLSFFAFLIETGGAEVGRAVRLHDPTTTIGRDQSNHVIVNDELASAIHATIRREQDGRYIVADQGSKNGTRINGRELSAPRAIRDNDEIGIGATTLVLKVVRPRTKQRPSHV
jgi:pSer/pThr/pTyr-binding forkhead associated (FHA) protein